LFNAVLLWIRSKVAELSVEKSKLSKIYCKSTFAMVVWALVGVVGAGGAGVVNLALSQGHPVEGLTVPFGHFIALSVDFLVSAKTFFPN
jgi:large-conductance mechanosensitive channel